MQNIDKALRKLSKGEIELLTAEEKLVLMDNLKSEDLNDFQEIIREFNNAKDELQPSETVKSNLLQHFKDTKHTTQSNTEAESVGSSQFYLLKIAAAAVLLFGLGTAIYVMNNTTTDETTLYIETDEFNQFTQIDQVVNEEDTIANDTKFLLSMDFFSNSSISLDYK